MTERGKKMGGEGGYASTSTSGLGGEYQVYWHKELSTIERTPRKFCLERSFKPLKKLCFEVCDILVTFVISLGRI